MNIRRAIKLTAWLIAEDLDGVESLALYGEDIIHIYPISVASGEGFVDDEVFCGACEKADAPTRIPPRTALYCSLLKLHRAERDVHANAVVVF